MKVVKKYNVVGKIFDNKQKALELRNDLNSRARNLKLFYWEMRGYPGESTAIALINNFCHYHKFTFGKWKGSYIGEIMMVFPEYISWCIKNVPFFKMNKEEMALYNTSWKYNLGGTSWNITTDEVIYKEGDKPDYELIDLEKQSLCNY